MAIVRSIKTGSKFGGVISDAPYENCRSMLDDEIEIDIQQGDDVTAIRKQYRAVLREEQEYSFNLLKNRLRAERIQMEYDKIRFRQNGELSYPSVTSILSYDKDFFIPESELMQYAARGTLGHKVIEHWHKTGEWLDLKQLVEKYPDLREEAAVMYNGGLKLSLDDCSYKAFFEKYGKDIVIKKMEYEVFNREYLYSGRVDIYGEYKGVPSIMDIKFGGYDMRQLAAYAKGDGAPKVEQLVVLPVGPNDNKTGVKAPVVRDDVDHQFDLFLKKRNEFKKRFGI